MPIMGEYLDLGTNLQGLVETLQDYNSNFFNWKSGENDDQPEKRLNKLYPTPKAFLEVRESICVVGYNREAIQQVKSTLSQLVPTQMALESFCVKKPSDVKDGAFLVPKLVLVATHCPGKKLLDDEGDEGQLDVLYDEACEVGADIMVVYMELPKIIYKPMRHMVYHPKVREMLFPTQTLLKELAGENCFVTVTEGTDFTHMQKNVLREWMTKPVGKDHPVYKTADYLSSLSEAEMSETESCVITIPTEREEKDYQPATEEHPLADKARKKKEKKKKRFSFKRRKEQSYRGTGLFEDLETLTEKPQAEFDASVEMDVYRANEFSLHTADHMNV